MPRSPRPEGYVYRTTEAQRARRASYVLQHREAVNAYARDLRAEWKASFVGPLWPQGMRKDYSAQVGPTKGAQRAQEVAGRKAIRDRLKAAKALGRQLAALRHDLEPPTITRAEHRKTVQGPPKPDARVLRRLAFVGPPKPSKVAPVVLRPTKPPKSTKAPRPVLVGPVKPSHATLAASIRAERNAAKAAQVDQAAQDREGRAWDRSAVAILKAAVQTMRRLDREARRRAYAVEQERRRRLTPQQREAERQAGMARAEAIRLAALGLLAAQERERIEAAKAAEALRSKLDAEALAVRREAAMVAAAALVSAVAPVGRVAFTRPSRS